MGDEREMGEVSLDGRLQDDLWPRVAERRSILIQKVH